MVNEYKWMDSDEVQAKLEDALWDDYTFTTRTDKGHTTDVHIAQSDADLLSRIACEHKTNSSCFLDQETADDVIQNALIYKSSDIVKWIQAGKRDFQNGKDYQELAFSVNMGDGEPIGRGFNDQFQEIESPTVRVVLQRDFDLDTPFGFYVKSAYVDITDKEAELTGVEYTRDQVAEMDDLQFSSPMEETVFRFQNVFEGLQVRYIPEDYNYPEQIRISQAKDNTMINVYISQDDIKIKQKTLDQQTRRIQMTDLEPSLADKISVIKQTYQLKTRLKEQELSHPIIDAHENENIEKQPEQMLHTHNDDYCR